MREILKVLVGSHAYGLATPQSDYDYRGVFIVPTADILLAYNDLGPAAQQTSWLEGKDDDTSYEVGRLLFLASKCNPSILEVFKAPIVEVDGEIAVDKWGMHVRDMFDHLWHPKGVAAAFGGYSFNQRKKFLEGKDGRPWKFAVAYVRSLLQGIELLSTGDFHVEIQSHYNTGMRNIYSQWNRWLRQVRDGAISKGAVIDIAEDLRAQLDDLAINGPYANKQQNLDPVRDLLLDIRSEFWRHDHA